MSQAAAMVCMPLPMKNTAPQIQSPRKAGWRSGLQMDVDMAHYSAGPPFPLAALFAMSVMSLASSALRRTLSQRWSSVLVSSAMQVQPALAGKSARPRPARS